MHGYTQKRLLPLFALLLAIPAAADWRKDGTDAEKLSNLTTLVPGTSHWMAEMGERYQNIYWAAKQEKWKFTQYQAEEIEKLVKIVMLARPKRAASAQTFLDNVFPGLNEAIDKMSWKAFEPAFVNMHGQCMACHAREDHAFVTIPLEPATAHSPVLNLK